MSSKHYDATLHSGRLHHSDLNTKTQEMWDLTSFVTDPAVSYTKTTVFAIDGNCGMDSMLNS